MSTNFDSSDAEFVKGIARVTHEANRALCQAFGDDSQLPWESAPQWQVESAIQGVRFHRDNPDAPPSRSHENWMAEKVAAGWVHGSVKDADKKTHPCLVPYEQLPPEQRAKDYVFSAIVRALLGRKSDA